MGLYFSKKPKITEVDKAILTLKIQRRKLTDYQKKVEAVVERERETVKELVRLRKKERAILTLKRIRIQENALTQASQWLISLEQQLVNIETASQQKAVFESLKSGHAAIEELQQYLSVDDVEQLLADTQEAQQYQKEIEASLGPSLSEEEEAQLLDELDALEAEFGELEEIPELPSVPIPATATTTDPQPQAEEAELQDDNIPELPSVPSHLPTKAVSSGRDEKVLEGPLAA